MADMSPEADRAQFLNRLRMLHNIDRFDASFLTDRQWPLFRSDPVGFLMRADDDTATSLFGVVVDREARRRPEAAPDEASALLAELVARSPAAKPEPLFDDWGDFTTDTPGRAVSRALENEHWEVAALIRSRLGASLGLAPTPEAA